MKKHLPGSRIGNWLLKYKLHHLPVWCLYHYLWWTVAVANPLKAAASIFSSPLALVFIFYVVFQAAAVYINLYYLVPKYMEKSRFIAYSTCLVLTILSASLCIVAGYYITAAVAHQTVSRLFGAGTCFFYFSGRALPSTVASTTLALCIKLIIERVTSLHRQQLQEKQRLEAELQFLKYQFNPHFLFNSINSIFFLINTNPKIASSSLSKFSELLRHQLYDCNEERIPLSKEVNYLQNFIGLEKLRRKKLEVVFTINPEHTGHLLIAPFILMTFVENAFKHVSRHKDQPNEIQVQISLAARELHFTVCNTVTPREKDQDVLHYGGIGLQNVKRRLDLLYGEKYSLEIENMDSSFSVKLCIQLDEHIMTEVTGTAVGIMAV